MVPPSLGVYVYKAKPLTLFSLSYNEKPTLRSSVKPDILPLHVQPNVLLYKQ